MGSRSVFLNILTSVAREGWVVNATSQLLYPPENAPVPIVHEAGWAPWQVWTRVEKRKSLALTGVQTPNRPVPSKSLYQLRYPGPPINTHKHRDHKTIFSVKLFMFQNRSSHKALPIIGRLKKPSHQASNPTVLVEAIAKTMIKTLQSTQKTGINTIK